MTVTSRPARQYHTQQVHYLRRTIAYNTPNVGTSDVVQVGTLPSGAKITGVDVWIDTAFNAATTNVLTVGTSSGSNADIIAAGDVDEATVANTLVVRAKDLVISSDTVVYAKYTQSGTAATTGSATVIVYFVPNNDQ